MLIRLILIIHDLTKSDWIFLNDIWVRNLSGFDGVVNWSKYKIWKGNFRWIHMHIHTDMLYMRVEKENEWRNWVKDAEASRVPQCPPPSDSAVERTRKRMNCTNGRMRVPEVEISSDPVEFHGVRTRERKIELASSGFWPTRTSDLNAKSSSIVVSLVLA